MTREAFTPSPRYPVSGTGPYQVTHPYRDGTLIVAVVLNDSRVQLLESEYSVSPIETTSTGEISLTAQAATDYDGGTLYIRRATEVEQGWVGQSAREKGLEAQLDWFGEGIQDLKAAQARTLRTDTVIPPIAPKVGQTIIWGENEEFIPGPSAEDIKNALPHAQSAAASAGTASTKAAEASASATAAAASAPQVETVLDTFDDRHLGSKESEPTTDNDGDPLQVGAIYFRNFFPDKGMYIWDGSAWGQLGADLSLALQKANNGSDIPAPDTFMDNLGFTANAIALVKLTYANMRTALGLGTAATKNTGADIGDVPVFEDVGGNAAYPAGDGSQITNLPASGAVAGSEIFTASGTFTVPDVPDDTLFTIKLWGAGGGGGSNRGGGGGAYKEFTITKAELGATETVTVAAAPAANANGGNSSFGSFATAYGGTSGSGSTGGNGGGIFAAGGGATGGASIPGNDAKNLWEGAGGGGETSRAGGDAVFGGAGGGGFNAAGSVSLFGGDGGPANSAGIAPGGGGSFNAAGSRGEVRIYW